MNTDSFIIHIKTGDFCKDIADDVENWFDLSNMTNTVKDPFQLVRTKK